MIISVMNQKGGVGKTTTVINLGVGLGMARKKVLLIDLDPQGNLSSVIKGREDVNVIQLLDQKKIEPITKEYCDIISSSVMLVNAETNYNRLGKEFLLKKALEQYRNRYDYIIIDTPPNLGLLTTNALIAADRLLIPMTAEKFALDGLQRLKEIIDLIKENYNSELKVAGILLIKYNDRTIISRGLKGTITEYVKEQLETQVYKTYIRESTAMRESQIMGLDIYTYNKKSNPAKDYLEFTNEFIKSI